MGERRKPALSVHVQTLLESRFPRFPRHLRWRPNPGARIRRATRAERIDRAASVRLAPWEEYTVPFCRLAASIRVQSAGWLRDLNDAQRPSQDPSFRLIGSEKNWDRGAALTPRLQTFETDMLAEEENFAGLAGLNRALIGRAEAIGSGSRTVLDMDSTEIPESKNRALTMGTPNRPVITRCCCSMARATA